MAAVEFLRVDQAKIVDYLLNVDAGDKATFILSRDSAVDAPDELAEAVAAHAAAHWPGRIKANAHVTKHIVDGPFAVSRWHRAQHPRGV